jgi:hypothetical protein
VAEAAAGAGRDPAAIGLEGRITLGAGSTDELVAHAERWRHAGATHVTVNSMGSGLASLDSHLDGLASAAKALQLG